MKEFDLSNFDKIMLMFVFGMSKKSYQIGAVSFVNGRGALEILVSFVTLSIQAE